MEAPAARQVLPEPIGSFKQCKIVMENGADTRITPACSTMPGSYSGHLIECDCHRQMNDHRERTCCDVVSTPNRIDSPMCFSTCKCENATHCGMRSHQAEVDKHGVGENGALGNETGGHEPHMDFHWSPSASAAAAAKIAKPPANETEKTEAKDPAVEAAEKVEAYDDKIHHEAADEPEKKDDVNATAAA